MYHLNYQYSHDIDWFCRINGIPVHLASNGGHLPSDSYTIDQLVALQHQVANLEPQYQCEVNTEFLKSYLWQGDFYENMDNIKEEEFLMMVPEGFEISRDIIELPRPMLVYCWSFIEMARRGFFSFDRNEMIGHEDTYHLVAWPKEYHNARFARNKAVYESLKSYNACCFPPFHENYKTELPDYIKFDISSIPQRLKVDY